REGSSRRLVRYDLERQAGSTVDYPSTVATISPDGRFVVVPGGVLSVEGHDVEPVPQIAPLDYAVGISPEARFVAFTNWSALLPREGNGSLDVFVYDRAAGILERSSINSNGTPADGYSYGAGLSGDGRFVAFYSGAQNLTPFPEQLSALFLHDRQT